MKFTESDNNFLAALRIQQAPFFETVDDPAPVPTEAASDEDSDDEPIAFPFDSQAANAMIAWHREQELAAREEIKQWEGLAKRAVELTERQAVTLTQLAARSQVRGWVILGLVCALAVVLTVRA